MNVSDLRKVLGMPDLPSDDEATDHNDVTNQSQKNMSAPQANNTTRDSSSRQIRVRRQSMEQLDLIKVFLSFYFMFVTIFFYDVPLIFGICFGFCFMLIAFVFDFSEIEKPLPKY